MLIREKKSLLAFGVLLLSGNCKFAKNFRCLYENCNDIVNIVIHLPLAKLVISILFNKFVAHYCSSSVCSSSLQIQSDETMFHVRYLIDFKCLLGLILQ